jgi:5-methyltetrahydropteroyltriglutamate--homocysteine methyltransferase
VGSLIRPQRLIEARARRARGEIGQDELEAVQHDAIREVVALQQDVGLKAVTDGEYNRGSWQTDFLVRFANVAQVPSTFSMTFHSETGDTESRPHMVQVTGPIARTAPIFVDDFRFLESVAGGVAKITLPSPSIMHFRGGRAAISAEAYPDLDGFYEDLARVYREEISDLAEAGCRYLQLDEVNFAYLCDPKLRAEVKARHGEDADALVRRYARLINETIRERPTDMVVCMHLCRGNFAGNWVAEGGYEPVAELLFNEIGVDGYFLEYDTGRAGGFEPLRLLPAGKAAVLGLVTTKRPQLESQDELMRKIEAAARHAPLEQLCLSPQCGFSSGLGGETMTIEAERRKLRLVVETAAEVWG